MLEAGRLSALSGKNQRFAGQLYAIWLGQHSDLVVMRRLLVGPVDLMTGHAILVPLYWQTVYPAVVSGRRPGLLDPLPVLAPLQGRKTGQITGSVR